MSVYSLHHNGQLAELRIFSFVAPFFAYVYNIYPIKIVGKSQDFLNWFFLPSKCLFQIQKVNHDVGLHL